MEHRIDAENRRHASVSTAVRDGPALQEADPARRSGEARQAPAAAPQRERLADPLVETVTAFAAGAAVNFEGPRAEKRLTPSIDPGSPGGDGLQEPGIPDTSTQPSNRDAMARSRRAADHDAVCSAVMNGLTEPFMIPYVLALGGTTFQAGLLSSVRNLLLAFVQLGSATAIRRLGSRRALVLWTAGLQALLWIPLAAAKPWFGDAAVLAVIAAYTLGTASAALGGPAWGSLVADYTAPSERGRWFGRRARLAGLATTVAGVAAGALLEGTTGDVLLGFGLLCGLAALARAFSFRALTRFYDAGWTLERRDDLSFARFLSKARTSNFARFSLCMAGSSFAAHVAAPYFAVYLLEGRGYGYAEYTAVVLAGSLTGLLTIPWWGRLGDRFGNRTVLRVTTAGVVVLPGLWLLFEHPAWMLLWNVLGAFFWGGLNLSASNFVYDAVSPARRASCIAYFNVLNGLGVSLGALTGGWLASATGGADPLRPFLVVFAVSMALRLAAAAAFHSLVREVRAVRPVGLREAVLDLVGQRLVALLGMLSVDPELEHGERAAPRKRAPRTTPSARAARTQPAKAAPARERSGPL
jgi:MFS family permease